MLKAFGDRRVSISREMTKIYEETLRMTLSEAVTHFENVSPRGEFVIVVEGKILQESPDDKLDEGVTVAADLIEKGFTVRDAVKRAALDVGCSRNMLYKLIAAKNG
jgi:16S rRNA (cytidine1402-2'-O)-methyltransferase